MNIGTGENKDTSSYALVPVTIHTNNQETSTWPLLDMKAMANFMDIQLAKIMDFFVGTQGSVILTDGSTLSNSELARLTDIYVEDLNFSLQFTTVENISFSVLLGFPGWQSA